MICEVPQGGFGYVGAEDAPREDKRLWLGDFLFERVWWACGLGTLGAGDNRLWLGDMILRRVLLLSFFAVRAEDGSGLAERF